MMVMVPVAKRVVSALDVATTVSVAVVEWLVAAYLTLPWLFRLFVSGLPFLLWAAEIRWWAAAPYWLLVLNGAQAGCWAGLFFCSIWLRTKSARYEEEKTVFCD